MKNPIDQKVATVLRSYTVLAIIALLIGAALVPAAVSVTSAQPQHVAVVNVDETITSTTAEDAIREFRSLRENDSVAAVVLRVDSPGGSAAASEAMYMAVKRLAAEKPVVTSVGSLAASGAYYTIAPSDEIYVTPGSIVGHVGVIATAPSDGLSGAVTTGPDKAHRGMTKDEFRASVESLKRSFVGAVMNERGDELSVSRETVAEASAYTGGRAVQTGYADGIGDVETAIAAAAEKAGLSDYAVSYRDPTQLQPFGLFMSSEDESPSANGSITKEAPYEYSGVDTVHFLMVYGVPEEQTVIYNATATGGA